MTMRTASTHHVATDCYSVTLEMPFYGRTITLYRETLGSVRGIATRWINRGILPKDVDQHAFYNVGVAA